MCQITYRYPRTQRRSVHQPSRSRRRAGACSWPYQCEHACRATVSTSPPSIYESFKVFGEPYWTISGRIGAENTVGRGWEAPEGLPAAVAIETVGREAIIAGRCRGEVEDPISLSRGASQLGVDFFRLVRKCGGAANPKPFLPYVG